MTFKDKIANSNSGNFALITGSTDFGKEDENTPIYSEDGKKRQRTVRDIDVFDGSKLLPTSFVR